MSDHRAAVEAALRAVSVELPTVYTWFGRSATAQPAWLAGLLSPAAARDYLVSALQRRLYDDFYTLGTPRPSLDERPPPSTLGDTDFVRALSEANSGAGALQEGWLVTNDPATGELFASKDGLTLGTELDATSTRPEPRLLSLRLPKALLAMSPGYYLALGDRDLSGAVEDGVLRLYWHVRPEGAVELMRRVTTSLNAASLPFRLKLVNDPALYSRCDAAVLYLRRLDFDAARSHLVRLLDAVERLLRPGTPAFARRLAPGLGLAEDPPSGDSFGLDRCRLLAEAVVRAHEAGVHDHPGRLRSVEECFAEAGISLDAPYLNPGSTDAYDLPPRPQVAPSPRAPDVPNTSDAAFLDAASRIAAHLCSTALWHDGRCSWLGARPSPTGGFDYAALGPDLYAGTSGIAVFLTELSAATGDPEVRRAALGAARQALALSDDAPGASDAGLYIGRFGVALAAARAGRLLAEDGLVEAARTLLRDILASSEASAAGFDLVSGKAGAILALLTLRRLLHDASLIDAAARLAGDLIDAAERSDAALSWPDAATPGQQPLTGLSHGASGGALAFLEARAATADARYRDAAEAAFVYERRWLDAAEANWPDFRGVRRRVPGDTSLPYAAFWCHGAPGIALARLRAFELTRDAVYRAEAETALATTRRALETALAAGIDNACLCHGLSGLAEVLLQGDRVLGRGSDADLVRQALATAWQRFGASGAWPLDAPYPTPGLMVGTAGVGHLYLRLARPSTPSLLLLRPEDLAP